MFSSCAAEISRFSVLRQKAPNKRGVTESCYIVTVVINRYLLLVVLLSLNLLATAQEEYTKTITVTEWIAEMAACADKNYVLESKYALNCVKPRKAKPVRKNQ